MKLFAVSIGLVASVCIWTAALIPTWVFLAARTMANPEGFWQNVALFGLGFWFLGSFQLFLIFAGIVMTVMVWTVMLSTSSKK